MKLEERIQAFVELGNVLISRNKTNASSYSDSINEALEKLKYFTLNEYIHNPWFISEFIEKMIDSIGSMLHKDKLKSWLSAYPYLSQKEKLYRIGVVMAGNIPLVGFHDFLCVLMAGDVFMGKLSSNDKHLLPAIAQLLCAIEPRFSPYIIFTEEKLEKIDKIIATGSNNTSRYFEYYFAKYPSIIRKHCNSVAILKGNESEEELRLLVDDICLYFGLGCRSVSKVYVPQSYNFVPLFKLLDTYKPTYEMHHSYMNNLEYQKTVHLINKIPFFDQGILMFKEDTSMSSPISVVHYEYYTDESQLLEQLNKQCDSLQCTVCNTACKADGVGFGKAQFPNLDQYANKIDTLAFLLKTEV